MFIGFESWYCKLQWDTIRKVWCTAFFTESFLCYLHNIIGNKYNFLVILRHHKQFSLMGFLNDITPFTYAVNVLRVLNESCLCTLYKRVSKPMAFAQTGIQEWTQGVYIHKHIQTVYAYHYSHMMLCWRWIFYTNWEWWDVLTADLSVSCQLGRGWAGSDFRQNSLQFLQ
jgi:hypothetical protein